MQLQKGLRLNSSRTSNTRPSPNIKFVGLFDSVKAIDDECLFNVEFAENISHLRHALALMDMRAAFHPMRFLPTFSMGPNRTCLEGWFLGDHSNIGGGKEEDGASLWPLQWILSEAVSLGLVLGFKPHPKVCIPDPVECAMPRGSTKTTVTYKNGLKVNVWDLLARFQKPGFVPETAITKSMMGAVGTSERPMFNIVTKKLTGWSSTSM